MTKEQLLKKLEDLEQEIHNATNTIEYYIEESNKFSGLYFNLESNIENNPIMQASKNCSLIQMQKIEDFIKTL